MQFYHCDVVWDKILFCDVLFWESLVSSDNGHCDVIWVFKLSDTFNRLKTRP